MVDLEESRLEKLTAVEAAAVEAANVPFPGGEMSSAVEKWAHGMEMAKQAAVIEAWGAENDHIAGAFRVIPSNDNRETPVYQSDFDSKAYLFVMLQGHWCIGGKEEMTREYEPRPRVGSLRSAEGVLPGTLPHSVADWQVAVMEPWQERPSMRFWLQQSAQLEWQKSRVQAAKCPVFHLSGVSIEKVDGLFDVVSLRGVSGEGCPPTFQHQIFRDLWIYLAADQRWYIGNEPGVRERAARGHARTIRVLPGELPWSPRLTWQVENMQNRGCWNPREVVTQQEPTASPAVELWHEVSDSQAELDLWGICREMGYSNGSYHVDTDDDGSVDTALPAYRCADGKDWVYVARDGHWWFGCEDTKNKRVPPFDGTLRSKALARPGMHLDEVDSWEELLGSSWQDYKVLRFWQLTDVNEKWQAARSIVTERPVVKVDGSDFGGLFDFMCQESSESEAPAFKHQTFPDRWLFLATDRRWWVGDKLAFSKREPRGWLRSEHVGPGQLPMETKSWRKDPELRLNFVKVSLVITN